MATSVKQKARKILDGVIEISKNEQLVHGTYLSPDVMNPMLTRSICGGHQACLIGSVAVAAQPLNTGTRRKTHNLIAALRYYGCQQFSDDLGTCGEDEVRKAFAAQPELKVALDALNAEAAAILAMHPRQWRAREARKEISAGDNPAEAYFETYLVGYGPRATHNRIVSLCEAAKTRI